MTMDMPRGSASVAMSSFMYSPPSSNRGVYDSSSCRPHSRSTHERQTTALGVAIPGSQRALYVPPALPPPRHIEGLEEGIDLSWHYQNLGSSKPRSRQTLAPIQSLSPYAESSASVAVKQLSPKHQVDDEMEFEPASESNKFPISSLSTTAAQSHSPSPLKSTRQQPDLVRRFSSGITQSLHGDTALAQQSQNRPRHAYDQQLLQRITKTGSPPHSTSLSIQTQAHALPARPFASSSIAEPAFLASKGTAAPYHQGNYGLAGFRRDASLPPTSPATSFYTGSVDTRTRSERGSHDSVMSLDGRSQGIIDMTTTATMYERPQANTHHGAKRQALSPASESSDLLHATAFHKSMHPSSLTSTASESSYRASYTSSNAVSAASSMTTLSTTPRTPRHSISSPKLRNSTLAFPNTSSRHSQNGPVNAHPSTKDEIGSSHLEGRASRIGAHFICSCCPKKPRKFSTEEQLRSHESEKQYTCAYCNNRFKNKNEAERHQNSLHVRKQSWSCAAITSYHAAFHPASSSNTRKPYHDVCGFCGDHFSNNPVNWEERMEHVISTHKFAECNTTKKFYRADHFRQHLKHSHAGKTGKWTNILENNCQRDEEPPDIVSNSPTASDYSTNGPSCGMHGLDPAGIAVSGATANDRSSA